MASFREALVKLSTQGMLATALVWLASVPLAGQELPHASPADVGMSAERLDRLTAALSKYVEEGRLPGGVTMVLRDGNVVYREAVGFRDRESQHLMRTDAIFRIASQTKAIVSVGIMMLQEDGGLLISDPLSEHLPEFRNTTVAAPDGNGGDVILEAERQITLRDLLTHTSGLGYGNGRGGERWEAADITGWYFAHRREPIRETVRRMAELPMLSQPGEAFVYGYSTDVLGAVIEVVSGKPLNDFLRERILEPLDMRDTHFYLPPEKRDRLAVVYNLRDSLTRAADGPGMTTQGEYVDGPRMSYSGGAGLLSTARDYARFLQMLLNGGELNGRRLLSPKTVALMTTDHIGNVSERGFMPPAMGFGLGFQVRLDVGALGEPGSVGDYGWGGAYHSTYWVDPVEDLVVVYFTQVIPAGDLDDHVRLRAMVYSAVIDPRSRAAVHD